MAFFDQVCPRRLAAPRAADRESGRLTVTHAGAAYPVAIKRVAAARRFTLRVRAATGTAVLTMPPRASLRAARTFAERHAEWIAARLDALPATRPLAPGALVPLRGVDHRIVQDPLGLRRNRVAAEPASSEDEPPRLVVTTSHGSMVGPLVEAFLRREALADLGAAATRHAVAAGVSFARLSLKDTRSRWGSCSSRGTLSFSWRLVMAPAFVLDYLAAHEVAHLRHMDHSAAFWRLTRSLAPRTDAAEAWLRAHGPSLYHYVTTAVETDAA